MVLSLRILGQKKDWESWEGLEKKKQQKAFFLADAKPKQFDRYFLFKEESQLSVVVFEIKS